MIQEEPGRKKICVCKYPIFVLDQRDGVGKDEEGNDKEIEFYALPVQVIGEEMEGEPFIPAMEIEERESFTGITGSYMRVEWQKAPKDAKAYDVNGHIVLAGCPVDKHGNVEMCETKFVFVVYHPLSEWMSDHIIEWKSKTEREG